MKKRKLVLSLLIMCLTIGSFVPCVFADDQGINSSIIPQTYNDSNFKIIEDNGVLYIKEDISKGRIGGGIGQCPKNGKKTFYKTFTRKQAQAALRAEQLGEGSVKALGALLGSSLGLFGIGVDIVVGYLGGESVLVRSLNNFLDTENETAQFEIKTHCVSRGYMYGDPMYDYEIVSIKIIY